MRRLAILTVIALLIAGCGASNDSATTTTGTGPTDSTIPFQNGELASLDVARAEPSATDADIAAVTKGDVAFGLDLLRATAGDGNLMLSPYSIATALSMLYPGARGETASQIAAVLHLDVPDATLNTVRNAIEQQLGSEPTAIPGDDREPFTIRPANSAWGQGGYPFLDNYLSVLAKYYGAGIRLLDFVNDPSGATDTINSWVEERHRGPHQGSDPRRSDQLRHPTGPGKRHLVQGELGESVRPGYDHGGSVHPRRREAGDGPDDARQHPHGVCVE